ncbi:MAG TPA: tRNA lysidine(34) synthetase TilS [Pyrinomonadaceae bacterium]|nr:tRNA lysidine(34) synthetase TilS [Pyrinomonadaceae bacterium]
MKRQQQRQRAHKTKRPSRVCARRSDFAQALCREWKKLKLSATNANVVVAVSGGADSVALLLSLDELVKSGRLKLKLFVAHLDHGLRKNASKADARWVSALAKQLGHAFVGGRVDVAKRAARAGDNLEQAARRARYEFLADVAMKKRAGIIVTAHTMDDQAETVLMNLLRGSGTDGLGGMEPTRRLNQRSKTILARPLLSWARRRDTESYSRSRGVEFRHDEMNADEKFNRVRVRRQLLPLMESFNPKIVEGLMRTAEVLREDSVALNGGAARLLELASEDDKRGVSRNKKEPLLQLDLLAAAPPALRRRALRQWLAKCRGDLKRVERVHVLAVESLLFGNRGGRVIELPGGSKISRTRGFLNYHG